MQLGARRRAACSRSLAGLAFYSSADGLAQDRVVDAVLVLGLADGASLASAVIGSFRAGKDVYVNAKETAWDPGETLPAAA